MWPLTQRAATPVPVPQGELQHLLVTATCLLLVRQSAGRALGPAEVEAAKRRLRAVLSDPSVRLPDIGAECARLAGGQAAGVPRNLL